LNRVIQSDITADLMLLSQVDV